MKLAIERLPAHLDKSGLARAYLIYGEEPLQQMEAADAIRHHACDVGVDERMVLTVEPGFDWRQLAQQTENLSLFASRRLIELRLGDHKPGRDGSAALLSYLEQASGDDVLVITAGKLDRSAQQSKWFKAFESAGVTLASWPVAAAKLPGWISQRLKAKGLTIEPEAARLLAERVEGNLLAAKQELDRVALLIDDGPVDVELILELVADNARFDLFELPDCALGGDAGRTLRVLEVLRQEGVEPVMVNWLLTRELRQLSVMAAELADGRPLAGVVEAHGVWRNRQPAYRAALQRLSCERLVELLGSARRIDRVIKGSRRGDPWVELRELCAGLAGVNLPCTERV
jgi:DNA polymerase-3 subunit delta